MMEELGIVGTIGIGMKEILENGENEQRRRSIFLYLSRIGMMKRI